MSLQSAAVRDLAWACFSPPLIRIEDLPGSQRVSDCRLALTPDRRQWLERLDRTPAPLLRFLAENSSPRLGIYFEKLWQFLLREAPGVRLLAANLPVREGGRTLGEFDLIYYCGQRQRAVHLELAVKFYLGHPTQNGKGDYSHARQWLGPNSRDRLDIKLGHMLERQIRLGDQQAAAAQLAALGIDELHREIAFKGTLFQPAASPLPPPAGYNQARPMQQWYQLEQWQAGEGDVAPGGYLPLERLRWLAPASAKNPGAAPLDRAALGILLQEHFSHRQRPLLVAQLDEQGCESGRFFITGNRWPDSGQQPVESARTL